MAGPSVIVKSFDELTTRELYEIARLRASVFLIEQKADDEEFDGRDTEPGTRHDWISDRDGSALAYLRTLWDDEPEHKDANLVIGRVVTRADARGRGLASILVDQVIAENPGRAVLLHAQEYVQGLYAKAGFEPFGEVYEEGGIAHIGMYRAPETVLALGELALALRDEGVGQGVDAGQVPREFGGDLVPGRDDGRIVVGDLGLPAVVPDEGLERQVKGGHRGSRHHRRARGGAAEDHQHGVAHVEPGLAGLGALVDHGEQPHPLCADDPGQPRDGVGHGQPAGLGDDSRGCRLGGSVGQRTPRFSLYAR
jgi:ElaA protein